MANKLPPGPKGRFFTGSLHEYRKNTLAFLERCVREHGDFVTYRLGPTRIVLINDPEAIESILVHENRRYRKDFVTRWLRWVLGNGLVTSEGDFWLRQRRLSQPGFHKTRLVGYADVMTSYAEGMLNRWRDGDTFDVHEEMIRLTLAIAARTFFDADVEGDAPEVGQALEDLMLQFNAWIQSALPLPMWVPTMGTFRRWRVRRRLDAIVYRIIQQRRRSGEDRGDLLSLLLQARDEDGSRMTDKQLRDEMMTMMLAGHETTAVALSWAWYLLAQHPEVEQKLHAEWQGVLGGRTPTAADLPRLVYTERVVKESMRLYPPVYVMGRGMLQECEVGGYRFPAGTEVEFSQWLLHRDPRYWDQPERFDPDRWADGRTENLPRFAYFPFGGGPRVCIGNTFAMMETILVLATVGQRFHLRLVPDHPIELWPAVTLRPRHGIRMTLSRREQPGGGGSANPIRAEDPDLSFSHPGR